MIVTATEFKNKFGQYLELVEQGEDIIITKNGKHIAKVSDVKNDKSAILQALVGIIPADTTLEEAREERLKKYESDN